MALATAAGLVDALRQLRLLDPAHLEECVRLQQTLPEPRALAKELMQRGWLTPFQANHLLQGKGAELLLGSYLLLERLGEGGMGTVFKARHRTLDRIDALKVIRKKLLENPQSIQRFQREARAAARLSHPNVITVYDAGAAGDTHFLAMEYAAGTDLSRLVKTTGPLPVGHACEYIRQAALGLQHAFEKGLIHRDIKPSNLLLTKKASGGHESPEHVIKILDMGLARLDTHDPEASGTLTESGDVVGTPDYIAPEQARNAKDLDIRADLYSLGCTFYFLLAGRSPFQGETVTEKLIKHQLDEAPPLEGVRSDVPPEISAIIRKLMAKKPADRFQTPAELAAALQFPVDEGMLHVAIPVDSPPIVTEASLAVAVPVSQDHTAVGTVAVPSMPIPRKRRPWLPLAVGGAAAVLLLAVAVWGLSGFRTRSGSMAALATTADKGQPARTVRVDSAKAKTHLERGLIHLEAKRYDAAIADLTRAIEYDPLSIVAYVGRANAYFAQGELDKALNDQQQVIKLDPKNAIAHFNRGTIFDLKGDRDRAIAAYTEALRITPGYTAALVNRGSAYMEKEQFDLAIRDFTTVIGNDPMSYAAYNNRGLAHYRRKDYDRALADFNEAIRLNASFADAYYNRSLVHEKQGNQEKAEADHRKAKELDPKLREK